MDHPRCRMSMPAGAFNQLNNRKEWFPSMIFHVLTKLEHALDYEGIFRISGARVVVDRLMKCFHNGDPFPEEASPYDIASALKQYCRERQEPLIPFNLYKPMVEARNSFREEGNFDNLKAVLNRLPPDHFISLQGLIEFLTRVAEHSSVNMMDTQNLGVVFGPSLMRELSVTSFSDVTSQTDLVTILIEHYSTLFPYPISFVDLPMPPGWVEGVDSSSHQKYYVFRATNSTQWRHPCMPLVSSPSPSSPSTSHSSLPTGWVVCTDTSGKSFYVNQELGLKQWDVPKDSPRATHPTTKALPVPPPTKPLPQPGKSSINGKSPPLPQPGKSSPVPPPKLPHPTGPLEKSNSCGTLPKTGHNPESLKSGQVPTKRSSDLNKSPKIPPRKLVESPSKPSSVPPSKLPPKPAASSKLVSQQPTRPKSLDSSPISTASHSILPHGWQELRNAEGKVYYLNTSLNITQWECPFINTKAPSQPPAPPQNDSLPPGWEEHTNEQGKIYYYNRQMNLTQWDKPQVSTPPQTIEALPPGWEVHQDSTSGKRYYVHRPSNTTSWTIPEQQSSTTRHVVPAPMQRLPEGPAPPTPPHSGWMFKDGGRVKNWKRRFFIIRDLYLEYYKESNAKAGTALGTITLSSSQLSSDAFPGKEFSFTLKTPGRDYHLQANSAADLQAWIQALKNAISVSKKKK